MRHDELISVFETELEQAEARIAADCVCTVWGGECVRVGKLPARKERNAAIREQWNSGHTPSELAAMFRVSRSQIYRVLFGQP